MENEDDGESDMEEDEIL
jgi:hypothetical protein